MGRKVDQGTDLIQLRTILQELQAGLRNLYGKNAPTMLIYGSYARGQAHLDSDIDILLVYPRDIYPGEEIRRVGSILADLNLRYQVLISILPALESEYRDSQNAFWNNVRRESIPIEAI
jgi:predicted nucleotidyltransferase